MTEMLNLNGNAPHDELDALLDENFKTAEQIYLGEIRPFGTLIEQLQERTETLSESLLVRSMEAEDNGLAVLLTKIAKDEVVYGHGDEAWFYWNGLYWQEDRGQNMIVLTAKVFSVAYSRLAGEYIDRMSKFVKENIGKELTKEDKEHLTELENKIKEFSRMVREVNKLNRIKNVLVFAAATQYLGVLGDVWDSDPRLLGVKNAILDLTTGKPVKPDPKKFLKTVAPVPYDPDATAPIATQSFLEIQNGDRETLGYIQRQLGYAMSGECVESDLYMWYGGEGRNGKEFMLNIIRETLGEKLAGPIQRELLLKSGNKANKNGPTESLMALRGRRIAWASETDEGQHFDLSAMKDLSGGKVMSGRHNHAKQVEWVRSHTLFLLTNNKPHLAGGGAGAEWDRIKVIPFTESFVNDPDPNNPHEHKKKPALEPYILKNELPGVLNWLIEGLLEWRKNGLQPPKTVTDETQAYRKDEDTIGDFIEDCCLLGGQEKRVKPQDLYDAYKEWCVKVGTAYPGRKTFLGKVKKRKGIGELKSGQLWITGIGLLAEKVPLEDK